LFVKRLPGHVAFVPVGVLGYHAQLLWARLGQPDRFRLDAHRNNGAM